MGSIVVAIGVIRFACFGLASLGSEESFDLRRGWNQSFRCRVVLVVI